MADIFGMFRSKSWKMLPLYVESHSCSTNVTLCFVLQLLIKSYYCARLDSWLRSCKLKSFNIVSAYLVELPGNSV